MRVSAFAWVMVFSVAAIALQLVKYSVQDVAQEVQGLQAELDDEKDAIKMLNAEWAYLTRPDRLRKLSDKYLELVNMSGERVVVLDVVPGGDVQMAGAASAQPRFIIPTGMSSGGRY